MTPRFQPSAGASAFAGEPGHNRDDNRDGNRRRHPTSDDGSLAAGATFRDLATGEEWYYDGDGWKRAMTGMDRVAAEVAETRRVLAAGQQQMIVLLEEIRDLLLEIA